MTRSIRRSDKEARKCSCPLHVNLWMQYLHAQICIHRNPLRGNLPPLGSLLPCIVSFLSGKAHLQHPPSSSSPRSLETVSVHIPWHSRPHFSANRNESRSRRNCEVASIELVWAQLSTKLKRDEGGSFRPQADARRGGRHSTARRQKKRPSGILLGGKLARAKGKREDERGL